jgi:PAS domain-containing protein
MEHALHFQAVSLSTIFGTFIALHLGRFWSTLLGGPTLLLPGFSGATPAVSFIPVSLRKQRGRLFTWNPMKLKVPPESLLRAFIADSNEAIWCFELDGTVALWNAAAEELYGFSASEVIGKHLSLIIPRYEIPAMEALLSNPETPAQMIEKVPRRIREGLSREPDSVARTASIGAVVYPEDGRTTQELLEMADRRLYAGILLLTGGLMPTTYPTKESANQLILKLLEEGYQRKTWHGPNLKQSLKGVSAQEAAWRAAPGRHNIWELALHSAYWKYAVRRKLEGAKRGSFVLRGSNFFVRPETGKDTEAAWRADLAILDKEHRALVNSVRQFLRKPVSAKGLRMLYGVAYHDVYHAGQIRLLRRFQED